MGNKEIKRNREYFTPIIEKIKRNFKGAKKKPYGYLFKNIYVFGSYVKEKKECGDIDIFYTYNKTNLNHLVKFQKELGIIKVNYKECGEFPECLYGKNKIPNCFKYGYCLENILFKEKRNKKRDGIDEFLENRIKEILFSYLLIRLKKSHKEKLIDLCGNYTLKNWLNSRNFDMSIWKIKNLIKTS